VDELKTRLIDDWERFDHAVDREIMLLSPSGGVVVSALVFV